MKEDNVVFLFGLDKDSSEVVLVLDEQDAIKKKVLSANETPGKKMDKAEKEFEVKVKNKNVAIEDGHEFIKNLKKEAGRQKAMKAAESLELQTRQVEFLPTVEAVSDEIELADSFEITEE